MNQELQRSPQAMSVLSTQTIIEAKSLWINLELAKKPVECIEFILVHELVHLIERHHNERFKGIMDKHLPNWRERRSLLNSLPLAYEDWSY
jgi:predicted metal-dependent hydrolase